MEDGCYFYPKRLLKLMGESIWAEVSCGCCFQCGTHPSVNLCFESSQTHKELEACCEYCLLGDAGRAHHTSVQLLGKAFLKNLVSFPVLTPFECSVLTVLLNSAALVVTTSSLNLPKLSNHLPLNHCNPFVAVCQIPQLCVVPGIGDLCPTSFCVLLSLFLCVSVLPSFPAFCPYILRLC